VDVKEFQEQIKKLHNIDIKTKVDLIKIFLDNIVPSQLPYMFFVIGDDVLKNPNLFLASNVEDKKQLTVFLDKVSAGIKKDIEIEKIKR